jgi:hypothetical protein
VRDHVRDRALVGALGDAAYLGDPAVLDRDLRAQARQPGAIDHAAVLDE